MPAVANLPGNYSITMEVLIASYADFKDGMGIADPADPNNPCTAILLGWIGMQPYSETWEMDQNMGTNLNGPSIGISNLVPPLAGAGPGYPASGGINLGIACPIPGSPLPESQHPLWLIWSGINWHGPKQDSFTQLHLCTQEVFLQDSPGCLAFPDHQMHLWVSACKTYDANLADGTHFGHDYMDGKGKYIGGQPFDQFAMKNDMIECTPRRSVNYTQTIWDFSPNQASQTWDAISNQAIVPYGSGTTYVAICWKMPYLDFQNPLNPVWHMAQTHDWKLIIDLLDEPADVVAALDFHYGSQKPGDNGPGPTTSGMRGFYSGDAGYSKGVTTGQNGPGPCTEPTKNWTEILSKPSPVDQPPPPGKAATDCKAAKVAGTITTDCNGINPPQCTTSVAGATTTVTCAIGACPYGPHDTIATAYLASGTSVSTDIKCGNTSILPGGPATDTTPLPEPFPVSKNGKVPSSWVAYSCIIQFNGDGFGECGLGSEACLSCPGFGAGPHRPPPPPPPPPPPYTYVPGPPGHFSWTHELLVGPYFDFKDGVGIADPNDENNPCTNIILGLRVLQPYSETWEADQNMGTNLNGPAVGIGNLTPPLIPVPPGPYNYNYFPNSGGLNLAFPCPLPGSPNPPANHNLWLIWSGMNWRSAEADSSTQIHLCSWLAFSSESPGCLAIPTNQMHLWASACNGPLPINGTFFGGDYTDSNGKYLGGVPFDTLRFKSDLIKCPIRRSVNYTMSIQDFTANQASQTWDIIKNEAVVPYGSGTTYMAVCWTIDYLDFSNPLGPVQRTARTHDWKLIIDLADLTTPTGIARLTAALERHYGGWSLGDNDVGGHAAAMRGFYSYDAGNPKSPGSGENGAGPCINGPSHWTTWTKPDQLI
jgi:hypothetical protein